MKVTLIAPAVVDEIKRGCPSNCVFYSVTRFFGRTYRTRLVRSVIEEIRVMNTKFVGFSDDNIFFDEVIMRILRLGRRIPLQLLPLLLINFSFRKEIAATQKT